LTKSSFPVFVNDLLRSAPFAPGDELIQIDHPAREHSRKRRGDSSFACAHEACDEDASDR
jgi:hypothetical protein